MSVKSFYDLDYIIEINEKRIEQYASAYQKVLDKLTNIILIYSAVAIFLVPIIQGIFLSQKREGIKIGICFFVFIILFLVSVFFTIRLLIPVGIAYLKAPKVYYAEYRLQHEREEIDQGEIENLLQASYIDELEQVLEANESVLRRKSAFYYNALMYGLLSIIPYLVCFGFHITEVEKRNRSAQFEISGKNYNFVKNSNMSKGKDSNKNNPRTLTQLPGVDNSLVIPSSPIYIKENSSTPTIKKPGKK